MQNTPNPDPRLRFSDRVDDYVKHRPTYPAEVLRILADAVGRSAPWSVADIGSGTGIFSELLLQAGHRVLAVEPNAKMRAAAEALLGENPNFASIDATAEATTLPAASVDLITAAQSLHWFNLETTRSEFVRILRPGGVVAAIWNTRKTDTPFAAAYEQFLLRHGTDYQNVGQRHRQMEGLLPAFFGGDGPRKHAIPNTQVFDRNGLRGRLMSSSYVPKHDDPRFALMIEELNALFSEHQQDGRVTFEYDTEVFIGRLS